MSQNVDWHRHQYYIWRPGDPDCHLPTQEESLGIAADLCSSVLFILTGLLIPEIWTVAKPGNAS